MVSASHTAHSVEVTAESLQEELSRLRLQKQALERELAAVVAHLGSVESALGALQALSAQSPAGGNGRPAAAGPRRPPAARKRYGRLTEQIMAYFASVGDADVRARDVAAALGRDADSGSINGVRSTLDRLVGTSRIRRTGRGLYRAARS